MNHPSLKSHWTITGKHPNPRAEDILKQRRVIQGCGGVNYASDPGMRTFGQPPAVSPGETRKKG
jgi:hypothetical protein